MKTLLCAAAAVACMAATPALAQDMGFYGTIGATHIDADVSDFSDAGKLGFEAVTGRAGVTFSPYFGIEGEASFGWEDATTHIADPASTTTTPLPDLAVSVDLQHDVAVFLVGRLPMTENASLLARAGYGSTSAQVDIDGEDEGEGEFEGFRYGVGAEFFFDDANGVRVDFTRTNTDEMDADAYSISYVRRFG